MVSEVYIILFLKRICTHGVIVYANQLGRGAKPLPRIHTVAISPTTDRTADTSTLHPTTTIVLHCITQALVTPIPMEAARIQELYQIHTNPSLPIPTRIDPQ